MKRHLKIIKSIAASSVGLILMIHSPGAAAAACGSTIIPTQIVSLATGRLEFVGTLQSTTCPCTNSQYVYMVTNGSEAQAGHWEALLLAAKATGRPVYAYSFNSTCNNGWWTVSQLYADAIDIL